MKKSTKITIISIIVIGIIMLGLQVYAYNLGYSNVFFLIKELVVGTKENSEVFSDEEIVLSYKKMEITDGVSLQLTKIENYNNDNLAKLYMIVDNTSDKSYTFEFVIGDIENPEQKITKTIKPDSTLEDSIEIDHVISKEDNINFSVLENGQSEPLLTLQIDIANREINILKSDYENQISQIEMKRYIEAYTYLIQDNQVSIPQTQVLTAIQIAKIVNPQKQNDRSTINEIAKTIYGNDLMMNESMDIIDVPTKENFKGEVYGHYIYYDKESDEYKLSDNEYLKYYTKCLEITNVKEENDGYIVTCKEILNIPEEELKNNSPEIENKEVYEIIIKLTKNDTNNIKYIYNKFDYNQETKVELINEEKQQTNSTNITNQENNSQEENQVTIQKFPDEELFGKWITYNVYDSYGGMVDFSTFFGSGYSQYGSSLILNSDYTFVDAIRPISTSEYSNTGTFTIKRNQNSENDCYIILNYSDGRTKTIEVQKDYYNETNLHLDENKNNAGISDIESYNYDFKKEK